MVSNTTNYVLKLSRVIDKKNGNATALFLNVSNKKAMEYIATSTLDQVRDDISTYCPQKWYEVVGLYFDALNQIMSNSFPDYFRCYEKFIVALNRIANAEDIWILPVLRQSANTIYKMATMCSSNDEQLKESLEVVSRTVNGTFKICLNDRNSENMIRSKKGGSYFFAGMMLRIYFRLKAFSLANGIVKTINAVSHVLPAFSTVPLADRVVYNYYRGVLEFMAQKYSSADTTLQSCLNEIPKNSKKARETVLLYLIPSRQLAGSEVPSPFLWEEYPALCEIYKPIFDALKQGDLGLYGKLLSQNQAFLVKRHLYFALVKLTQPCTLRLICRTWIALGKGNRLKIDDLVVAFELRQYFADMTSATPEARLDAVELQVAQLISDGKMKGYISHSMRTIVLSNRDPFPTLVKQVEGK